MRIDQFDFELPPELVAQHPANPRDAARLLRVAGAATEDHHVYDLPGLLSPGDLLVLNDTRVIPARLRGRRGEAKVEVTLHKQVGPGRWRVFARPARRLRRGDRFDVAADFFAEVVERGEGGEVELLFPLADGDLFDALRRHGEMPLPPYIRRAGPDPSDDGDYQTMFAARDGAVAAPTAALHFTPELVRRLEERGVGFVTVTLHVGAGTFLPVKVDDVRQHRMHSEWGEIGVEAAAAIDRTRQAGGRIVAVGTTSLRLLESAAVEHGTVRPFVGETGIFILPGFRFRAADMLLTNFHLPRSTLFMLVCAFAGTERMRAAYARAIAARYRFYSYGDCCLLQRADAA